MWEPDTHQPILQAFAEPKVIAKGSENEGGEEKGRENIPLEQKMSVFQMPSGKKSFSKCQARLLELSSNIFKICRCP